MVIHIIQDTTGNRFKAFFHPMGKRIWILNALPEVHDFLKRHRPSVIRQGLWFIGFFIFILLVALIYAFSGYLKHSGE